MNAINYILKEHAKIRATFKSIAKNAYRDATRIKKFMALCQYLVVHETMEQTIWYPYLKKNTALKTVIKHLLSEEKSAAKEITKFKKIKSKSWKEAWEPKFKKFKAAVDHHANEEETKLFPKAAKEVEEKELRMLGKKLQTYRKKHNPKK